MGISKLYIPLLAMVVLVSGCTSLGDVFGQNAVSVQERTTTNGVSDIITVGDIQTIPNSPLLPDQQILLSFLVENKDSLKTANNVKVDLFNAPTMKTADGTKPCNLYASSGGGECGAGYVCYANSDSCNGEDNPAKLCNNNNGVCCPSSEPVQQSRYCLPEPLVCSTGCSVLPGEQKQITFSLRTPSEQDIRSIRTQTRMDFKTSYNFDSSLDYIVPAISTAEITNRQRTGQKAELFTSKSYSSGPVQVDVALQGAPYILSDSTKTTQSILLFTIRNKGSGNILDSEIKSGDMTIIFPPEFAVTPSSKFTCSTNVCVNNGRSQQGEDLGKIPLYRDESRSSLLFTVSLIQPLVEPFRSYQITANVRYNYELRNNVEAVINPFQNV